MKPTRKYIAAITIIVLVGAIAVLGGVTRPSASGSKPSARPHTGGDTRSSSDFTGLVVGTADANVLNGTSGADVFRPGGGADRISAGTGSDYIYLDRDGSVDRVDCGGGVDIAVANDSSDVLTGCEHTFVDKRDGFIGSDSQIEGTGGDSRTYHVDTGDLLGLEPRGFVVTGDVIESAEGKRHQIFGYHGNDYILATGGGDYVRAGEGNDFVRSGMKADIIDCGYGQDNVIAGANDIVLPNCETVVRFTGESLGAFTTGAQTSARVRFP